MRKPNKLVALIFAILASIAMLLPTSAYAAKGTNNDNGSITINNAEPEHTYNAYQVLVLESYDTEAGAYSYKANEDWADWLAKQTQYVSIDGQGYVTWKEGADVAAFAKAALAHATEAKIAAKATKTADSVTVSFTGLNLGYYLVDTTVGTLCSLNTTTPNVTMVEKNEVPPVEKKVQEDSDQQWGDTSTAEIGDTVPFQTTITANKGAQNYVLHDAMSAGLTLNPESVTVAGLTKGADATSGDYHVVTSGLQDGCTFEIIFHQSYLDTINAETTITVNYTAVLNENAVIAGDGNTNMTRLEYGDGHKTVWDDTKTYTYKVDVVKTDGDNKVLDGAEFKLYDAETGGNEIPLVKVSDGVYRFAKDGEQAVGTITTVNGQLEIKGFDANTTYWLEETKAPEGYNKLAGRVQIAIKNANLDATVDGGIWQNGGVHIINNTGSELPSTGGIGTAIFYALGGALVLGAIVFLSRKRVK